MQFNTYEFILLFLPISLLLYFTVGKINLVFRKLIISVAGLALLYFAGIKGLIFLAASMVINYLLCEIMLETKYIRKPMFIMAIAFNVLVLLALKYSNFAITNINLIFGKTIKSVNPTVPLGISFFTFQQIAYVVNLYKGTIEKLNLLDYVAYMLYFPKLAMGPIVDPIKFIEEINNPKLTRWNWDHCASGIKLFCFGLFKKMVLADIFALAVSWGSENMYSATSLDWILVMLSYTFQIYFDFSGYSDMAMGISSMMNISMPINFNSPYKALSVRDFWNRWHMSLTYFLTNYIYIPLGGSRKGKFRTYLNVMTVFIISGIWHGANWTFILWGALYGFLSVLDRIAEPVWNKIFKPIRWFITFIIVNIMWLLFNASSVGTWIYELKTMILGGSFTISAGLANCFRGVEMPFFEDLLGISNIAFIKSGTAWMLLYLLGSLILCLLFKNNKQIQRKNNVLFMILAALAFVWSFLFLGSESVFIYNYF